VPRLRNPVPPAQTGPAVLVQDRETLRHPYFCVHAGIQKLHRDGLSSQHLEPLKGLLRRAIMSANRHEFPVYVLAEEHSTGQETDWLTVAEAAAELDLSARQVCRLARDGLGTRKGGREWRLPRSRVVTLKQERDWKAQNGTRRLPRAA
jgi:hypothetical protein